MSNESNLLFEVLGVGIGFVGLILFLSLIATSISQLFQSACRLRYINLRNGLTYVLREVLQLQGGTAKLITEEILRRPIQNWGRFNIFASKGVTWIEPREIVRKALEIVERRKGEPEFAYARNIGPHAIEEKFLTTEPHMKERFQAWMRAATAVIGLAIAFVFQVNSLDVIRELSVNENMRKQFSDVADSKMSGVKSKVDASQQYEALSDNAYLALEANHPELQATLDKASKADSGKLGTADKLSLILADTSIQNRNAILREYGVIFDSLHSESISRNFSTTLELLNNSAVYNLSPWSHSSSFYCRLANWVGVLVTAILLSLGAPFWFETLRKLMALRDQLRSSDLAKRESEGK